MRPSTLRVITCRASVPSPSKFHGSSAGIPEQTAEIVPLPEVEAFQYIIGFGFEL